MDNLKIAKLFFGVIAVLVTLLYIINLFVSTGLDSLFGKAALGLLIVINSGIMGYDSWKSYRVKYKSLAIATSAILFVVGVIPILIAYNLLNFSESIATLTVSTGFMVVVLFFSGVYFILNYF